MGLFYQRVSLLIYINDSSCSKAKLSEQARKEKVIILLKKTDRQATE